MSRVAALFLQLTLWVATVRAFFPFVPEGHCAPDENCIHLGLGSKRDNDGSSRPSKGVTVDLHHRTTSHHDTPKFDPIAEALGRAHRKFGRPPSSPVSKVNKRKNSYSVSKPATPTTPNSTGIYQYGPDYSYFIRVLVGSAQQPVFMLLDTGAANSWIMGSDCKSAACELHDTFDPSSSKSWKLEKTSFAIEYGSGSVSGVVGQDTASFAGITHDLEFGVANYTTDEFRHFAFDGIFGLGLSDSATGTFLRTLKEKKVLDQVIVSISLNRHSDGPNHGQVTFGGIDKTQYTGEITYHNVGAEQKKKGEWAITLDDVHLNGKAAGIASKPAYIDTGTSFIFAPEKDLDALFKAIPGSTSVEAGDYIEYRVPCDTTLPILLTFSGVNYAISSEDWVVPGGDDNNKCLANLYGHEVNEGTWLVGDTFLKNVYSVFDADKMRIGFAAKPAPSPKPTSSSPADGASQTSGGGSAVSTPAAGADGESARPFMPGSSSGSGRTAVPDSAQTVTSAAASAGSTTQVNSGSRPSSGVSYASMLCLAALLAMRPACESAKCPECSRMARATSHGAAAAADSRSSSNYPPSSAAQRNIEEATGLLSPGDRELGDVHDDDADDRIIAHRSSPHDVDNNNTNNTNRNNDNDYRNNHPRTPRTPNRVRFDLRPTIVDDGPNRNRNHNPRSHVNHHEDDNPYPRESFDMDDEAEPLTAAHQSRSTHQQRVPLLTGIEAPSVTVAASLPAGHHQDAEDWAAAERARPKSSLPAAFMNMANSIIGAGIIGQPYAFRQAGLLAGVVLLVVLTAAVDWTIRLIVVNSKLSGASSFQGTVERCFGRTGLVAVSVAQWAFAFGGMVAFGVIVGDSIPAVLRAIWPGLHEMPVLGLLADRRTVIVVFTLGVSYPLALYRDIAKLAKASTLALVSMAVIVLTVVVQGAMVPAEARGTLKDWRLLVINDGIFQAIGVISFAFVCHHNSLLIYGSLEKPTIDRFSRVTHISTAVSMVACMLMALSGFLTFGDKTQGNVLNNFPADNTMVNIARLCFGLNMLTTLPLEAFVCREVMLNYYFPGEPFNMNLHLIFTSSLVFTAMVLSLLTCDLGSVFDLVGGTSAAAMAYILPPLCYIKLTTRSWRTKAIN
ncbi:aspartic peptidase domain-containing protein [Corynascus novoguineensis]|uniref:Aspartic peptidase domain-containing protein n=1 Tax=Corynascus novoguineensis TaxID=1126955 RepID=A0AAN7D1N2_9PEZI|nr:aspartic peptidase domain-containing protein [Corynascus novoguineensis]